MTTPFRLGAYVGNPNGNDTVAEAAFEAQFQSFTATLGAAPTAMNAFVDFNQAPSAWAANASWTAYSWSKSAVIGTKVLPVIGIPMSDSQHWAGNPAGSTNDDFFKAIVNGTYDTAYKGVLDSWANAGFKSMDLRLGWEMDGSFMPWFMGTTATVQSDWVAAFQHLSTLFHNEAAVKGVTARVVWNPADINQAAVPVVNSYPGDAYVDVISVDAYSPVYPMDLYDWSKNDGTYDANLTQWASIAANRMHYWSYPGGTHANPTGAGNGFGMEDAIAFAKAHNKPLSVSETGAGGNGTTTGPVDDPAFPQWLAGELAKAQAQGVTVAYANIWDDNLSDGNWDFSTGKPLEAAAWAKYFGATASTPAAPATVATTPAVVQSTLVVSLSEDAWQGDAQAVISVDGVQQGGVRTVTASHASGASQAISLTGAWTGAHTVAVTFLNDAWGGSAATDRNLYVNGITLNGVSNPNAHGMQGTTGTSSFTVSDTPTIVAQSVVGLPIVLHVSEDAWQGDAQFTVSVDGVQQGGVWTATASHASGASNAITLPGTTTAGAHSVSVNFLNDAWGGTAATDRNLYVDGIDVGGTANQTGAYELAVNGPHTFVASSDPTAVSQTLVVHLSEDMFQGDAQFIVSLDGTALNGPTSVSASHAAGNSQAFTFTGAFGVGPHDLAISFLNDAWGGTASTDRNLYLDRVELNGAAQPSAVAALFTTGTQHLTIGALPTS